MSYTFNPGYCGIVDEACTAVEVVDRCLYVDFSFVTLKTCRLESNLFALYIGGVEMESYASSFKNESCGIKDMIASSEYGCKVECNVDNHYRRGVVSKN